LLCKKSPRNIRGILISNVSFEKSLEEKIVSGEKDVKEILPYLLDSVYQLEKAGADFIVIPCNTLHTLLPEIKECTSKIILDLIEEVSKRIDNSYKTIGIISTTKTREEKLYDKNLKKTSIIYPSNLEQIMISEIVVRIIRGNSTIKDKIFLENVISSLINKGAQKVLLACTDLANLIKKNTNTLDTTEMLINLIKKRMN
jgi:aspartate racemase